MTTVVFDRVWREYGDTVVLEDISLTVTPCSFLAIVGPSGAGKTTLLRMALGEESPTRGNILIDGKPLRPEPHADRGVVFQRYSVFPHLTALANVMIGREFAGSYLLGRLHGAARRKATEDARELLESVGLKGHEDKYPAQLSGGMQQRLALAQAIFRRPEILLLDEPFASLDAGTRADIHALMLKLWNREKLTVLMVTHDLSEAFFLGTRIVALERPRNRPEERERYGARLSLDLELWPRKTAKHLNGSNGLFSPLTGESETSPPAAGPDLSASTIEPKAAALRL